ncbi:gamma-glutamyl phosphate reductase [Spirochaetia bacterium]|nr:gamma-glutamyl phosphate reductase [Spirochaetia bacterium]
MSTPLILDSLKIAQRKLALSSGTEKNAALLGVASALRANAANIQAANTADVEAARMVGMKEALVDRLALNAGRIEDMAAGVETVAALEDPIGKVKSGWTRPNGLRIRQVTVPLGVAAIIYESRPNVTADAFAIAYKAGCSILLRGSSSALASNRAIVKAIKQGLTKAGGVHDAVELAGSGGHGEVDEILAARGKIDALIPRGGHGLIRHVVENARVPVIETGEGNCHIFVDESADLQNAVDVVFNAKTQRPGACNAVETVLVHKVIMQDFLTPLAKKMAGVCELRCDERSFGTITLGIEKLPANLILKKAVDDDWKTEYLDFILAIKIVDNLDEAITHINTYSTGHSESILTTNLISAQRFQREVEAACVYVNSSTRFTDGGEFGFGAELGISTQKFHARGPMGLEALTSIKYLIDGDGHTRQ